MAKIRMLSQHEDNIQHVNVLIHVLQAYSEPNFYFNIVVEPLNLVLNAKLRLSKNWLLQASLDEVTDKTHVEASPEEGDDPSLDRDKVNVVEHDQQLALDNRIDQPEKSNLHTLDGTADTSERRTLVRIGSISAVPTLKKFQNPLYLPWSRTEGTGILRGHGSSLHTTGRKECFSYKPLLNGYMRLLYLIPGTSESRLQAVLNHVPSNYSGMYQALSYVWGNDLRDKELVTPDGIIPVTTSLYKALLALRQTGQAVMVWADAVCINQADNNEKSQQIRLMPKIFQACQHVYAFVSEGSSAIDQALSMLMHVRFKAVIDTETVAYDHSEQPFGLQSIPLTWGGNHLPPLHSALWSSVKALFALPYFHRAWIVQEVVAAPNVQVICGEWVIDWTDLYGALESVDRQVQIAEYEEKIGDLRASWEPFTKLAVQREWETRQHRWTLLMLLEHFRHAESTLSRDRLFALVGLSSDGNEPDFEPDYNSSFPDIVLKFARAFVRQGRGIQLLYRAGLCGPEEDVRFPSWVPDWTSKRPVGLHDTSDTDITFSACGPQPPSLMVGPRSDELSVDGYDMDTILIVTTASNTEREWVTYFSEIDTMIDSGVLGSTRDSKEDLKWIVPIAAAPFPRAAGAGSTDLKTSYVAFRKYLTTPSIEEQSGVDCHAHKSYMACLRDTLAGWRFVVTKRGYIGVVPGLSRAGDVIAIMKGGRVPFVVRGSEERWRLIGECYVHGIMKGEGLWLPGVKERTFCLY